MRVLLTGASGHVGGAIARDLVAAGFEVVGLSRRSILPAGLGEHLRLDLGTPELYRRASSETSRCDAVVHAAAAISADLDDTSVSLSNCLGTQQIVRLARAWEVRQLVFLSSVPVVGAPRSLPVTEDHPTDPPTAYHASKLYGEALVRLAVREGLNAATLRLTSPVGPSMPGARILPVFVRRALSGRPLEVLGRGSREQNYVDVRDVARAVRACLRRRVDCLYPVGLYNVAGRESISNLDLARRCVEVLGSRSAIELADRPDPEEGVRWRVSIARAEQLLGYDPRFPIEQSIQAVASDHARRSDQ